MILSSDEQRVKTPPRSLLAEFCRRNGLDVQAVRERIRRDQATAHLRWGPLSLYGDPPADCPFYGRDPDPANPPRPARGPAPLAESVRQLVLDVLAAELPAAVQVLVTALVDERRG